MVSKYKEDEYEDEEDSEGRGSQGAGIEKVSFFNPYGERQPVKDEPLNEALSGQMIHDHRVSLKAQGMDVQALQRAQNLNRQRKQASNDMSPGGGGTGLESHPALPPQNGMADDIKIPDAEAEVSDKANNDPKLQLKQKLNQKFGMGGAGDVMQETYKEEMKIKEKARKRMDMRTDPEPDRPKNAYNPPRPTPP